MSRINVFPPVVTLYPNDRQVFTAQAKPPPPMWQGVTNSGSISIDFYLNTAAPAALVTGGGAHQLFSGIGIIEWTIENQCLPTSTGSFVFRGVIKDTAGTTYIYGVEIKATTLKVFDEVPNEIYTEAYSTVAADVYRLELSTGFRLYRNGVLKHSRLGLSNVIYPSYYEVVLNKPCVTTPEKVPPPRLIGDWRLAAFVAWETPGHGLLTTLGPSLTTEYYGGTVPGVYTLRGQIDPAADVAASQEAAVAITIPTLFVLGNITQIVLEPSQEIRFKTNYDDAQTALIAWSVVSGGGSFTQGRYTASATPGTSVIRATAAVNGQLADISVVVPPVITNANDYTAAKPSEQIDFDTNIPAMAPQFVSAGTVAEGTGAIVPALPVGIQINDIMLLFVESANEAVSTPSGWTAVSPDSPQGTGTGGGTTSTRITVFWRRVTLTESAPTVADPGDHAIGQILAFRGCVTSGDPWDVTSGDTGASSTSVSIPGDTTTVANCLVVLVVANATDTATPQTSGYTNADLASLTERVDYNSIIGNGGGFAVVTGTKAAAGAYGATAATLATASVQGRMSIALKPAGVSWTASIGSINASSGIWDAPSLADQVARIVATNGIYTVTLEVPVLEAVPSTAVELPWPVDYIKRVLFSEAEDGSRTWRIKSPAKRSFPVSLTDCAGSTLSTLRDFWDRHHPGTQFIFDDPEEAIRVVLYTDSDLRWQHKAGGGVDIAFRVKEA